MSVHLTGELVRLRTPERDDLHDFLAMRSDPEHLRRGTTALPYPPGPAGAGSDWTDRSQDPNDVGLNGFVIAARDDGRYLGTCGYTVESPTHRVAILGIGLRMDETGKGYGTDAVRVLCDFAFEQHGVETILLSVLATNDIGIRAYEKAGFEINGRLREAVWRDDAWVDQIEMVRVRPTS